MTKPVYKSKLFIGFIAASCLLAGGFAFAQMKGGHGQHMHGANGHDMVNMPGLQGRNATQEESEELAIMFRRFGEITRTVENLPNGIRTVTFSADEELMNVVTSHVIGMIDRVDMGESPEIIIQSPTLDILFERRASIVTEMDPTAEGIVVVQTSDDPEVVDALHIHAGEVSAMVERGMEAVHEMMAARNH